MASCSSGVGELRFPEVSLEEFLAGCFEGVFDGAFDGDFDGGLDIGMDTGTSSVWLKSFEAAHGYVWQMA